MCLSAACTRHAKASSQHTGIALRQEQGNAVIGWCVCVCFSCSGALARGRLPFVHVGSWPLCCKSLGAGRGWYMTSKKTMSEALLHLCLLEELHWRNKLPQARLRGSKRASLHLNFCLSTARVTITKPTQANSRSMYCTVLYCTRASTSVLSQPFDPPPR